MCKKMMRALKDITEMYETHVKLKDNEQPEEEDYVVHKTEKTKKPATVQEKSKAISSFMKDKRVASNNDNGPIFKNEGPTYSYKNRIAALRKFGKKQIKSEDKQEDESDQNEQMAGSKEKKASAYFLFMREKRDSIRKQYPELSQGQLARILRDVWKQMTEQQRKPFEKETQSNRKLFDIKFKKYFEEMARMQKKRRDPPADNE